MQVRARSCSLGLLARDCLTLLLIYIAPSKDAKNHRISVASSLHSEDHLSAGDAFAR